VNSPFIDPSYIAPLIKDGCQELPRRLQVSADLLRGARRWWFRGVAALHLVAKRSEGTYRYYKLADDGVFDLWRALRDLARDQLPEIDAIVERYLGPREAAPTPSPDSLAALDDEDMILLDVRPEDEYREGHLPGSRSVPIDEIEDRADELPEDEEYLVYCRGPFCVYSDQAVDILNDTGRQARRLEPGLPDWKAMGLTVATDFEEVDA